MILKLDDVHKTYARASRTRKVVDGASLELGRGQIMGIFGPAGAGKTTLLRIASGLELPDSGTVHFNGERLDQMSSSGRTRYLRREVGCVWAAQEWTSGLSVLDHVTMPLLVDGRDRRSAEQAGLRFLAACGAEQYVSMDLHELSDGERHLVSLARALVTEPRLLLVDGAVSNLSVVEQGTIMALLTSLAREAKLAVLVTGGQAATMPQVDTLLYMRDGALANSQPTAEYGQILEFPSAATRRAAADA